MAEQKLLPLLERLDRNYLEGIRYEILNREGFPEKIIRDAWLGGLIDGVGDGNNFAPENMVKLRVKGFLALNQIRLKKAIDKLNVNIKQFSKDSSKQGNRIINLTWGIGVLTAVMIILIIIQIIRG